MAQLMPSVLLSVGALLCATEARGFHGGGGYYGGGGGYHGHGGHHGHWPRPPRPTPTPAPGNTTAAKSDPCGGRVLRGKACDLTHPCPSGYICLYDPCAPGFKGCINGTKSQDTTHPAGKCPNATAAAANGTECFVHQDCGTGERCCSSVCTKAIPIDPSPQVTVLLAGGLLQGLANNALQFNSSVVLVQSGGKTALFDTGNLQYGPELLDALAANGIGPEDVDAVVGSHGHEDHFGNNQLFKDAEFHYYQFDVLGPVFTPNSIGSNQSYNLFDDASLKVIPTPGHTPQDTCLLVYNTARGTVGLAGDTILYDADYASSASTQQLADSRRAVGCVSDWIVPGHGPVFQVTDAHRQGYGCTNTTARR